MTNPNKNTSSEAPSLGDVLQLEATIEALPQVGLKDLSPTERIAISRYPEGRPISEGTQIAHISLSERVGNTGWYATAMNYMVLRDGDDTTTRLIKRPPFEIGVGIDPTDPEAVATEIGRATMALADYKLAEEAGMYDITAEEVRNLTQTIATTYTPDS
ncbi:MAG TPA: hypothetical protein VK978_01835 [Candidatus Saccharimonadales bacterium]|nr:hypothetical protein [Candidatus Saccharimonadales bacterium]